MGNLCAPKSSDPAPSPAAGDRYHSLEDGLEKLVDRLEKLHRQGTEEDEKKKRGGSARGDEAILIDSEEMRHPVVWFFELRNRRKAKILASAFASAGWDLIKLDVRESDVTTCMLRTPMGVTADQWDAFQANLSTRKQMANKGQSFEFAFGSGPVMAFWAGQQWNVPACRATGADETIFVPNMWRGCFTD